VTAISAHRGGSEHAPEGTYEAYRTALATGAEYVEFDIRPPLVFRAPGAGRP
jgi:glycerophosphoryl diester phosphodiesterase